VPRVGPIRALQEIDFGWRVLQPWEYGWQHPEHVCDEHCIAGRGNDADGIRRTYLFHLWQDESTLQARIDLTTPIGLTPHE
jgi:hypothetical protein